MKHLAQIQVKIEEVKKTDKNKGQSNIDFYLYYEYVLKI